MTLYAMSDVSGINIHEENGGCGQPHDVEVDENGRKYLNCPACEPAVMRIGYGWSATPGGVLSTPDEIAEHERLEKESARLGAQNLISQLRGAAGQSAQAAPQGLLDQMAVMQQAMVAQQQQIAELTAKLAEQTSPASGEATAGAAVAVEAQAPVKRAGRKAAAPPADA